MDIPIPLLHYILYKQPLTEAENEKKIGGFSSKISKDRSSRSGITPLTNRKKVGKLHFSVVVIVWLIKN